jgi:alpha-glucuronidase
MQLQGYVPFDVTPWEDASGGKAVVCTEPISTCTASFSYKGQPGKYELDVEYFDQKNGVSQFRVFVNGKLVADWKADASLPSVKPNADSSTRHRIHGVALKSGDEIRIEGSPDAGERAAVDYLEIVPAH